MLDEKTVLKGEIIDAEALIRDIDDIPDDDYYVESLATIFTRIAVQKPLITKVAQIGPSALRSYLIQNGMNQENVGSSLFNLIASFDKNDTNRELVLLYENDYGNTRELLHYLNSLDGENKIPYISRFLMSISNLRYKKSVSLKLMLADNGLIPFIKELSKTTSLKKYAGETNTNCRIYDWIMDDCPIWDDVIVRANCAIDLGGGYATPYLSLLFGKVLTSYDLIDPRSCRELDIQFVLPHYITRKEYLNLLDNQPWQPFDVFEGRFPTNKEVYFITSFGFATSTVRSIGKGSSHNNWLQLTHECFRRIAELVSLGKEVYFFFYGRPTVRVNRNKIMAFHLKDRKVANHFLLSDPFSMEEDKTLGVNYLMARKNLGVEVDAE